MRTIVILVFLSLTGCVSAPVDPIAPERGPNALPPQDPAGKSAEAPRFDPRLLEPAVENKGAEGAAPVVYRYQHGGKRLIYVVNVPAKSAESPAFRLVEKAYKDESIQAAVLEGFSSDLGVNSKEAMASQLGGVSNGVYPAGPPAFALELAVHTGVPYIGGDASDSAVHRLILSKGYTSEDLLGYSFVQRIPEVVKSGEIRMGLKECLDDYMNFKKKSYGLAEFKFDVEDFRKWYRERQGRDFATEKVDPAEAAPVGSSALFTQKIARDVSLAHDEHILNVISEMLAKHDTVLVVFGADHHRIQAKALEQAFGRPTVIPAQ